MDALTEPSVLTDSMKTPTKNRSISDPPNITSTAAGPANMLAPSPTFRERIVNVSSSKDDHDAYPTTPKASRRPLSLQMPPSLSMPSPSQFPSSSQSRYPAPLSPQLDRNNIYSGISALSSSQQSSPATSLPRHSRGLDFSRASTNLHHSTLAERNICGGGSSPDASPIVGLQKPLLIPGRNSRKGSVSSMMLDSPNIMSSGVMPWGASGNERSAVSSSVGSVNMLASESSDSDSDGDAEDASMGGEDNVDEDPIFTTPQVHKLQNPNAPTPFTGAPSTPGGGGAGSLWGTGHNFSPAQASLMRTIRRSRLHKGGKSKRKSSSSASGSGYSSLNSPRNTSPPPLRSIESATNGGGGYFNSNWPTAARSRRESLALGTDGLHLSSGNDSGDEASASNNTNTPSTPGVVRRAVTRRGNLLPKTKGFARIRAALLEEAAPIDTDVRQEAETIRQVRERDGRGSIGDGLDLTPNINRTRDEAIQQDPSSPTMLPAVPEGVQSSDFVNSDDSVPKGLALNFSTHASRNGAGLDYWNRYDASFRTPPPPPNFARQSSSVVSDMNIDSTSDTNNGGPNTWRERPRPRARSSASDAPSEVTMQSATQQPSSGQIMSDDIHLNRFKRRREDDFDISTIKRRAVSPGMGGGGSVNNSPILTQSPTLKEATSATTTTSSWGNPPERKTSLDKLSSAPVSASSEISTSALPPPLSASTTASTVPSAAPSRHGSGGSVMSLASNSTALGHTTSGGSGNGSGSAPGSSGGGAGGPGGKKLGLQGMVDTNDGLMKMSIE